MQKSSITVPSGVRYISQWTDFKLFEFPHILDKKIPGCGFTEYCLTNGQNMILCSPRKILLENKEDQHKGCVFYAKNEYDRSVGVDRDLTKNIQKPINPEDVDEEERQREIIKNTTIKTLSQKIYSYIQACNDVEAPYKILVTYDSFRIIKDILTKMGLFQNFYVVIDEFQSIFTDSKFKSSTEMEFVDNLQGVQNLCFVSATPMIDTYLEMLNEFKGLPYYELDWTSADPFRLSKPQLKVRTLKSVSSAAYNIIQTYKEGNFEESIDCYGNLVQSREAVFFINSVSNLLSIIKKAELSPDEVNILCADTEENKKKIRKNLGKKFQIGTVPLRGETHKMFTFCTRTVYLGADFYSKCARSFILSDANIQTLAVDITLDLPQILGRQRLEENPWCNRAELYFKTICEDKKKSREVFEKEIERKKKETNNLLLSYDSSPTPDSKHTLAGAYRFLALNRNYKSDYTSVNTHGGSDLVPVFNNLVLIAEIRAFEIQQIDYADRFSVFNKVSTVSDDSVKRDVINFLEHFESLPGYKEKMKLLCESSLTEEERSYVLTQIPLTYKTHYVVIGPERLKSQGYNITYVNKLYQDLTKADTKEIDRVVFDTFKVGSRYTKSDIKSTLAEIYKTNGLNRTAKASDLENYFNMKECLINGDGKRNRGFEILSIKEIEE